MLRKLHHFMLIKQHFLENDSSLLSFLESLCHIPLVSTVEWRSFCSSVSFLSRPCRCADVLSASSSACACQRPCSRRCLCFVWSPGCYSAAGDAASHLCLWHWIVLSLSPAVPVSLSMCLCLSLPSLAPVSQRLFSILDRQSVSVFYLINFIFLIYNFF